MKISLSEKNSIAIIKIEEENLDVSNVKDLKKEVLDVLSDRNKIIFDMSELQFVDSSGVGVLLFFLREMGKKQGDVKLVGINKPVQTLFELIRMQKVFEIYSNVDEAMQVFEE